MQEGWDELGFAALFQDEGAAWQPQPSQIITDQITPVRQKLFALNATGILLSACHRCADTVFEAESSVLFKRYFFTTGIDYDYQILLPSQFSGEEID